MPLSTEKKEDFSWPSSPPPTPPRPPAARKSPGQGQKVKEFFIEVVKIVVIALAIIIPVRYFVVQPFVVDGGSMLPNFHDGEYLIIDEISYQFNNPKRGDVVVFRSPQNESVFYIKRVIGLPGEKIQVENGQVFITKEGTTSKTRLDESEYLDEARATPGLIEATLGPDEYFVLGDNRLASSDSRIFGAVPRDNIIGRAWIRGYPFNTITRFETPVYLGL